MSNDNSRQQPRGSGELLPVAGAIFPRTRIDEAIDRAVGDMMEIDPRPDLRRRILSRIERPGASGALWRARRNVLWGRGSFVLLPAAAVLMIIVAVVASRWRESPVEVAQNPAPVALPVPVAPPAPPASADKSGPVARAARRPRAPVSSAESLFGPRRDRVAAASIEHATAPPEFVDIPPAVYEAGSLVLAPIVVRPLPLMQELRIAPIEIQRITVPALSPPR